MKSFDVADYRPIRIGAIVPKCVELCSGGCGQHGQKPHAWPNNRRTLLIYMPVMLQPPSEHPNMPFLGGPHTPPVEIDQLKVANHPDADQNTVRDINWN